DRNRAVLFADGHVENVSRSRFAEITNRGLIQLALASAPARREIAETPALAVTGNLAGGVGDQSKLADAPINLAVADKTDFEKTKIQNEDRKKLVLEGPMATGAETSAFGVASDSTPAGTRANALSPPSVAVSPTANPYAKTEANSGI